MNDLCLRVAGGDHSPPPSDTVTDQFLHLVHWTSAASRHLRRRLSELAADADLSDSELLVVWLCHGTGRVQVDLAGAIGTSPAQMSGMVERLRSRGLVDMHRLAADRRRQVCRTTSVGQSLLGQLAGPLEKLASEIGTTLSTQDQRAVQRLCEQLAEAIPANDRRPKRVLPAAEAHEGVSKEAA